MGDETTQLKVRWQCQPEQLTDHSLMDQLQPDHIALLRSGIDETAASVTALVRQGAFQDALIRVGNEYREELLHAWWSSGIMTPDDMRSAILHAWHHGPRQMRLEYSVWVEMFRFGGFVSSPPQSRPESPIEVWRGQPFGASVGMSWTTDRAQAEWFASRWEQRDIPAVLLNTIVLPHAILALDNDREEHEVVVDPLMLEGVREIDDEFG